MFSQLTNRLSCLKSCCGVLNKHSSELTMLCHSNVSVTVVNLFTVHVLVYCQLCIDSPLNCYAFRGNNDGLTFNLGE